MQYLNSVSLNTRPPISLYRRPCIENQMIIHYFDKPILLFYKYQLFIILIQWLIIFNTHQISLIISTTNRSYCCYLYILYSKIL